MSDTEYARPVVTYHEAEVIADILQEVDASETFFCQGKLQDLGVPKPILLYTVDDSAKMINLVDPLPTSLATLHQDCTASHFGQGREKVVDESYRLAREMLGDRFNLNFDPLAPRAGVLASISAFCTNPVEAVLYKLNCYTAGGHFKAHRDTPKATNHVGTLLIGLPAPYTGGELLLKKGDETITVDWSTGGRDGDTSFPWVFFYSDVEHEILPVTSGHRVTIAYDVYSTASIKYTTQAKLQAADPKTTPLYETIEAALKDREFLEDGGRLAFALSYEYPAAEMEQARAFSAILKGSDNALFRALRAAELTVHVKAAYKVPEEEEDEEVVKEARRDCYGPLLSESILMTATSFTGIDSYCSEGDYGDTFRNLLVDCVDAETKLDLVWTSKPSNFAWASTFAFYGNEPTTNHSYVAGVLVATVPPFGEGCRK